MFGKIATLGAMLALLLSVGSVSATTSQTPNCCATQTRSSAEAKDCCGTQKAAAAQSSTTKSDAACRVTGLNRAQCCASKASQMPPCCQQGCDTPGRIIR